MLANVYSLYFTLPTNGEIKAAFTRAPFHLYVTASLSLRLRLSFTRYRSKSTLKTCRFENPFKSEAFLKRYGFIGRVNDW